MTVTLFPKPLFGLFPTSHPLLRPRGRCRWQRRPWPLGVSSFFGGNSAKMGLNGVFMICLMILYGYDIWFLHDITSKLINYGLKMWDSPPVDGNFFVGKNWGFKPGDGMGYMIFRESHLFLLDPLGEIDELMKKLINTEESWIHFFGIPLSKTSEGYGSNLSNLMSQNFGPGLHFSSKDLLQRNALGSWCVVV